MNRIFRNIAIVLLLLAAALFLAEMHINKESPQQTWKRFDDTFEKVIGPPTPIPGPAPAAVPKLSPTATPNSISQ